MINAVGRDIPEEILEMTGIGDAKRKAQGAQFPGLFYSVFCMVA